LPVPVDTSSRRPTARAVAAGSTWQLITFLARFAGGFVAVVVVARSGGPRELGTMQLALTVAGLLMTFVGLGLPNLIAREIARSPRESSTWIESTVFAALLAGTVVTSIAVVVPPLAGASPSSTTPYVLAIASLGVDASARVFFAAFWGWERMHLESLATWLQEGSYLAGTLVVVTHGGGVNGVLLCYLGSRAVGALCGWILASRRLGVVLVPRPHRRFLRGVLRRSTPFAADDLLSMAYVRADSLLLGVIKGQAAVGLYQAGTNLVLNCNVLARMINNALYPRMSRCWPDALDRMRRLRVASLRLLALVGLPIAVAALLLADRLIPAVYGDGFGAAVFCFQLLALVIPIRMLGHTLGTTLTAADAQTWRTWGVTAAAAGNIGLNLLLVPSLSYVGSAWATVVTELGLLVAYALMVARRTGSSGLVGALGLPAAACLPMSAVIVLLGDLPLMVTVGGGALGYAAGVVGLLALRSAGGPGLSPRTVASGYLAGWT
jgi:O-antigen/teichoic acid export membrane protein